MGEILRKVLDFKDFKFDTEQGIFEGYASIFNKVDSYNEVVVPGAFKKHLSFFRKEGKILWQHIREIPIGLPLKVFEDETGLFIKGQITQSTQDGKEAIALIKEKIVNKLSFGYELLGFEDDDDKGIKYLNEIKVYDISPVTFPAMSFAEIQTIKSIRNGKEFKLIEKEEIVVVEEEMTKEEFEKPYPNEHACRLEDPGKYTSFARKKCAAKSDGKCIDFIFGILEGKSELQAMRYPKDIWTADSAKSHCKGKDGTFEAASKEVISEEEKREKEVVRFTQNIVSIENYLKMLIKDERDLSEVQDKISGLVDLFPGQTDDKKKTKTEITPELIIKLVKEKVQQSMEEILK